MAVLELLLDGSNMELSRWLSLSTPNLTAHNHEQVYDIECGHVCTIVATACMYYQYVSNQG